VAGGGGVCSLGLSLGDPGGVVAWIEPGVNLKGLFELKRPRALIVAGGQPAAKRAHAKPERSTSHTRHRFGLRRGGEGKEE
jgi:hypothetical protein